MPSSKGRAQVADFPDGEYFIAATDRDTPGAAPAHLVMRYGKAFFTLDGTKQAWTITRVEGVQTTVSITPEGSDTPLLITRLGTSQQTDLVPEGGSANQRWQFTNDPSVDGALNVFQQVSVFRFYWYYPNGVADAELQLRPLDSVTPIETLITLTPA